MRLQQMIVDADICIKIGTSARYRFLENLFPQIAERIYIHRIVYDEVLDPACAKEQINKLITEGIMEIVDENSLSPFERQIYNEIFDTLASKMINPKKPKKNKGEVSSLAWAKIKSIPYFATDEKNLQPIIDTLLNTGIDNILCLRIEEIIKLIKENNLEGLKRKEAKTLWRISGKSTNDFDKYIWPI